MKQYLMYECEVCGNHGRSRDTIAQCEASHFGLTLAEMERWETLKKTVRTKSAAVYCSKNERTEKAFDDAIAALMQFEEVHGLNKGDWL